MASWAQTPVERRSGLVPASDRGLAFSWLTGDSPFGLARQVRCALGYADLGIAGLSGGFVRRGLAIALVLPWLVAACGGDASDSTTDVTTNTEVGPTVTSGEAPSTTSTSISASSTVSLDVQPNGPGPCPPGELAALGLVVGGETPGGAVLAFDPLMDSACADGFGVAVWQSYWLRVTLLTYGPGQSLQAGRVYGGFGDEEGQPYDVLWELISLGADRDLATALFEAVGALDIAGPGHDPAPETTVTSETSAPPDEFPWGSTVDGVSYVEVRGGDDSKAFHTRVCEVVGLEWIKSTVEVENDEVTGIRQVADAYDRGWDTCYIEPARLGWLIVAHHLDANPPSHYDAMVFWTPEYEYRGLYYTGDGYEYEIQGLGGGGTWLVAWHGGIDEAALFSAMDRLIEVLGKP